MTQPYVIDGAVGKCPWTLTELENVAAGFELVARAAGWTDERLARELAGGAVRVERDGASEKSAWTGLDDDGCVRVVLFDRAFDACGGGFPDVRAYALGTIVHEIAHAWDLAHGLRLSDGMLRWTGGSYASRVYAPASRTEARTTTACGRASHEEDFAEAVAAVVLGDGYDERAGGLVSACRRSFVRRAMAPR